MMQFEGNTRARIRWILNHRLWTHPYFMKVPPEGESFFDPVGDHFVLRDDTGWDEEDVRDGSYHDCVSMAMVFVNPDTEAIDDDDSHNTDFHVWIEAGGWFDMSTDAEHQAPEGGWDQHNKWVRCHDTRLDCGASTLHQALLNLADLVERYYNDDGTEK